MKAQRERKVTTMKNTIKTIIIATAITIAIMISTACALPAYAEVGDRGEFYPRLAVVTSYERIGESDLWVITCTDKDGNEWAFYGEEEDAHIGNLFNLLMWNMSNEHEEEDEIVEVYYEGRMSENAMVEWLTGEWQ
jgi:hypothetical protein